MDRTERLLDLVLTFVHARRPITFEALREQFPADYEEPGPEAARRKFERDKADLLALGIPLRYVAPEEDDESEAGGYLVDRNELYLAPLTLDAEERALLTLSGLSLLERGSFPHRHALRLALGKIGLDLGGPMEAAGPGASPVWLSHGLSEPDPEIDERLSVLSAAISSRKRVEFHYRARARKEEELRKVDPYGLFLRRGQWALVGYAEERRAIRIFLVSRMRDLQVNALRPGTPDFNPPANFRVRDYSHIPTWRYESGEPVMMVELEIDPAFGWLAEAELGKESAIGLAPSGWQRFRVEATQPEALLRWVLGLGPRIRVVSPPELKERVRALLEAIVWRHSTAPLAAEKP